MIIQEHIYLSKDIFALADYFNNLTALKTINLENIQILYGIFAYCISLTEVNLQNIQVIRNNAFSGCENLDIDFSTLTNLQSIGENAFAMSGVTEFNPPSALVNIANDAFAGSQLETIFWYGQLNVNPIISSVENEIKLVIKNNCDYVNFYKLNHIESTAGLNYIKDFAQLATIIFEQDSKDRTSITIEDFFVDNGCKIICDSQATLDYLSQYGFDFYIKDYYLGKYDQNNSFYVRSDLIGADTLVDPETITNRSTITKQETSDLEGYILYTISYSEQS